jgi:hypothetical protein
MILDSKVGLSVLETRRNQSNAKSVEHVLERAHLPAMCRRTEITQGMTLFKLKV